MTQFKQVIWIINSNFLILIRKLNLFDFHFLMKKKFSDANKNKAEWSCDTDINLGNYEEVYGKSLSVIEHCNPDISIAVIYDVLKFFFVWPYE